MAGAVAFVFGLCALSFAAGCVVTAIMLRTSTSEEETAQPQVDPIVPAPQPEQLELRWPDDHFTAKPIHRNPVVSRPIPAVLDSADRVEVVEEVDDLADEVPELRPEHSVAADGEPVIVSEARPEGEPDGSADVGESEPVVADHVETEQTVGPAVVGEGPSVDSEAARFFLAYAARKSAEQRPAGEQAAVLAAEVSPEGESVAGSEPFGLASWFTTSDPESSAEIQPVERPVGEPESVVPESEPVVPADLPVVPRPQVLPRPEQIREASSRKGKRREIKLELVPQPSEAETAPKSDTAPEVETAPTAETVRTAETPLTDEIAPTVETVPAAEIPLTGEIAPTVETVPTAEQVPVAEVSASVSEPETVFASRSGLVVEAEAEAVQPEPDEPEPAHPDPEAVVPEQGVRPEPVSSLPVLVPTDEFRRRYLRTFEAARRRSSR